MNTKLLKISDRVHTELKVFVAKSGEKMADLAGYAIIKELKERGHKFVLPSPKKKK
jgi:hypothetical protein